MARPRKGQWTKAIGAHYGAVFNGRRWESFECLYCARVQGLISGQPSVNTDGARRAWHSGEWVHRCQGAEMHKIAMQQIRDRHERS